MDLIYDLQMANTDTLVTNMTSVDLENVCTSYILNLYSCYTAKESHTKICKFGYIVYHKRNLTFSAPSISTIDF